MFSSATLAGQGAIHPTAIVDASAELGANVSVGAYAIVGPYCKLGENVSIGAHAVLESHVSIDANSSVHPHACLGGFPQDTKFKGERSWVEIGEFTRIGEFVSVHRATGEDEVTRVSNHCLLMAYSHVGHNACVGDHTVLSNSVHLGGHVVVEDHVVFGGLAAAHQHCRIGRYAMIGGVTGLRQDIPPFVICNGFPNVIVGLNAVGLKRGGFSAQERHALQQSVRLLYKKVGAWPDKLVELEQTFPDEAAVQYLIQFIREKSKRGVPHPRFASTKEAGIITEDKIETMV
jgi:UDP-N-acetylglucosamine acyltransferase